jgi:hypothetical protein
MVRQSSSRLLSGVGERPFDDFVRLAAAALVLVVATAIVTLPSSGRPSSWAAFWSAASASMQSQPSSVEVGPRLLDQNTASRANDDGYLDGLAKALNSDL